MLGTNIQGTWRLDTPYLNNLVDLVGNIDLTTNADVPDPDAKKKGEAPLVKKGENQTLSGKMAVAYATYRASGEAQNAQLERFGQVMQGVLRKLSSDKQAATTTVQTLAQILDPSLTDRGPRRLPRQAQPTSPRAATTKRRCCPCSGGRPERERHQQRGQGRPRRHRQSSRRPGAAVRVGIKNATGNRTPPRRPASSWSTAATPSWTQAPPPPPRA